MRKVLDKLPLEFNWESVENATGAEGVGNYVNPLVGVRPVVEVGVPGHQRSL